MQFTPRFELMNEYLYHPGRACSFICLAFVSLLSYLCPAAAQESVPSPGPPQKRAVWITGATLHLGNGGVLSPGLIGFSDGIIQYVGTGAEIRLDPTQADIIDASGAHVYPGFFAFNSILGLNEIDAVRATRDDAETGAINPHVRALIAYNTDSRVIPTVRNMGVLLQQIAPQGGLVSGRSSVVQMDAWNWEDAAVAADEGIYINWPSLRVYDAPWAPPAEEQMKSTQQTMERLTKLFDDARAYVSARKPVDVRKGGDAASAVDINLILESMRPVFSGQSRLYVRVDEARGMLSALNFFSTYGIKPILVGVAEADEVLGELKSRGVMLVLGRTQSLPNRAGDRVDARYRLPYLLDSTGIPFSFSLEGAWEQRVQVFQAGQAVGYGLPYEEAVRALTLDAARITGVNARYGSLEVGKSATLFVSRGDAFEVMGNRLTHAFVDGRRMSLGDKQKGLYRKFSDKYGVERPE
ncbi:MAG: amidohydrolase family protein [Sphingomonadales bacterium]|nr:amidohydrolase family protein [Sphingomonadales bacterium]